MSLLPSLFQRIPAPTRDVLITVLCGIIGCLTAVLFHNAIDFVYDRIWEPVNGASLTRFALVGLVALVGSSLAGGLLLGLFAPEAAGSGIPQMKAAYWRHMGAIPFRVVWVKFIAGALTVGGGLSLGREGPTVHMAGGLASVIGGKLGIINIQRRAVTAWGAAAGLAAAFNTPIAAVTFVLEEVIEDLNSRFIGRILLASVVSVFVLYLARGVDPVLIIPAVKDFNAWTYVASLPVGAVAALVGVGFQKGTLGWASKIRQTSRLPVWGRPVIGGLVTWLAACLVYAGFGRMGVLGLGYQDLSASLAGELGIWVLLSLLLAKFIATAASYAWGNCGGIFAPTLFLGAMAGCLCGKTFEALSFLQTEDVRVLTVVGMSACLGAVVRAPVTSILIVFEMTHDFALVPPLMLATIVSQAVSRSLCRENFYNQVLKDAGVDLDKHRDVLSLADWKKRRVAPFACLKPVCVKDWNQESISDLLEKGRYLVYPVLHANGTIQGVASRTGLESYVITGTVPLIHPASCIAPDERLGKIEHLLVEAPLNIVLIVSPQNMLLGLFTLHDLLRSQISSEDDE